MVVIVFIVVLYFFLFKLKKLLINGKNRLNRREKKERLKYSFFRLKRIGKN